MIIGLVTEETQFASEPMKRKRSGIFNDADVGVFELNNEVSRSCSETPNDVSVRVCNLGGEILQTVQISRSASASQLRELLLQAEIRTVGPIIIDGRQCSEKDIILGESADANDFIVAHVKIKAAFVDRTSLRDALVTISKGSGEAHRAIIGCHGDVSQWDVSCVSDMNALFRGLTDFNQPIGQWNTAAVAHMDGMFAGA